MKKEDRLWASLVRGLDLYRVEGSQKLLSDLEGFACAIRGGFVLGGGGRYQFGKNSITVLAAKTFSPHLERLSRILSDEGFQGCIKIDLSKIHFDTSEAPDLSEVLYGASSWLNANTCMIESAADLSLIRDVVLHINSLYKPSPLKVCRYCFRVALTGDACHLHLVEEGNHRGRYYGAKVADIINGNVQAYELMSNYRSDRLRFSDGIKSSSTEGAHYEMDFWSSDEEIFAISKSIQNRAWSDAAGYFGSYLNSEFPNIFKRLGSIFTSSTCFDGFVRAAYMSSEGVDNRWDFARDFHWFMRTVGVAEIWFVAEGLLIERGDRRATDTEERDNLILSLSTEDPKLGVRRIAELAGCGKTTVANVIKRSQDE